MAYQKAVYFLMFLPVALLVYQLAPRKIRPGVLFIFNYIFFYLISGKLIAFLFGATILVYCIGLFLGYLKSRCAVKCKVTDISRDEKKLIKKRYKRYERIVITMGIILLIGVLVSVKYIGLLTKYAPIGISFYTLSAISYVVDVYWDKIKACKNILNVALFLSFFPQLMEGPICFFSDTGDSLASGEPLKLDNISYGYTRIIWGLVKKLVIADRLYPAVAVLYDNYTSYSGVMIIVAAVAYTIQLYMEFSGCMDIVIGSGRMFGVVMPENFNHPFVSKSASEFWRRWHITLGRWLKTYIFYPISMSGLVKKWNKYAKVHTGKYVEKIVVSAIALLPVWVCNGLWHGPQLNYLFYGCYYFVIIMLEIILEPAVQKFTALCHIDDKSTAWQCVRVVKTWVIIFTGEMFFRAYSVGMGISMFVSIFHNFAIDSLWNGALLKLGLSLPEIIVILLSCIIVGIGEHFKEAKLNVPVKWVIYVGLIMLIVIFGAYGPGYQEVDLIYAGF